MSFLLLFMRQSPIIRMIVGEKNRQMQIQAHHINVDIIWYFHPLPQPCDHLIIAQTRRIQST